MKVILNSGHINQLIRDLAAQIINELGRRVDIAAVGIRSRGEIIARRLCRELSGRLGHEVPSGTLDITLYRDDLNMPSSGAQPRVRTTEIGFDVNDKVIVLVDDVLYTGRSVRAAMDALIDLGRPKAIKLAVLVERKGREFPIQADFAGYKADIGDEQSVAVYLTEVDGKDEVVMG